MSDPTVQLIITARNDAAATIAQLQSQIIKIGVGTPEADKLSASLSKVIANFKSLGAAAKDTGTQSHAVEGLGGSLEHVGLSSERAKNSLIELTRALAEGDFSRASRNITELFSSLGEAAGLGGPEVVAILAVIAAVGGLVYETVKAQEALDGFGTSMRLTGGFAGETSDEFVALSKALGQAGGNIQEARNVLVTLISSGQFTSESIGHVAAAVLALADASGKSAESVAGDFAKMGSGVAKWAADANDHYHFLTLAQYDEIKTLEEQGDKQEAIALSTDLLTKSLTSQKTEVGFLGGLWDGLRDSISSVWDRMQLVIHGTDPLDAAIKQQQTLLSRLQQQLNDNGNAGISTFSPAGRQDAEAQFAAAQLQLKKLLDQKAAAQDAASQKSADAAKQQQLIDDADKLEAVRETYAGRELETLKAHLDAAATLQKTRDDAERAQLDDKLKANEISYAAYYARLIQLAAGEADSQIQALDIQLRQLDEHAAAIRAKPQIPGSSGELQQSGQLGDLAAQRVQIEGKIADLRAQELATTQKLNTEEATANRNLSDDIARIKARIAELQGKPADATADETADLLRQQKDILLNRPTDGGLIPQLLGLDAAKAGLDQIQNQVADIEKQLQLKQTDIQTQVQTGGIGAATGTSEYQQATAQAVQQLQALRTQYQQQLQKAIDQGFDPTKALQSLSQIDQKINELSDTPLKKLERSWDDTTTAMSQAWANWAQDAGDALTQFVETGKLNFRSFVTAVLDDLAKIETDRVLSQLLKQLSSLGSSFGFSGGAAAGASDAAESSAPSLLSAASGGYVSGPGTSTSDSIPAQLSNGEYVVRADIVQRFSRNFFDSLNNGRGPPKFAAGGFVGDFPSVNPVVQASGASTLVINAPVTVEGSSGGISDADARNLSNAIKSAVRAEILNQQRPGGALAKK